MMTTAYQNLLNQLNNSAAAVRSQAVLELGRQREERAVSALIGILCTDSDLNVQEDATWSLVRVGESAVAPLIDALNHIDAQVRHNIVHTLGKIASTQALPVLITASADPDASVRYKAVFALGQIGDAQAIPALVQRLDDERDTVRWMAREVLEGFGAAAVDPLLAKLGTGSADMQELVIGLLEVIGDSRAFEPLSALLEQCESLELRFALVQAIAATGRNRARALLTALGEDCDARIRAIARAMLVSLDEL